MWSAPLIYGMWRPVPCSWKTRAGTFMPFQRPREKCESARTMGGCEGNSALVACSNSGLGPGLEGIIDASDIHNLAAGALHTKMGDAVPFSLNGDVYKRQAGVHPSPGWLHGGRACPTRRFRRKPSGGPAPPRAIPGRQSMSWGDSAALKCRVKLARW